MFIKIEMQNEATGQILLLKVIRNNDEDYLKLAEKELNHLNDGTYYISDVDTKGNFIRYATTIIKTKHTYSIIKSEYDEDQLISANKNSKRKYK